MATLVLDTFTGSGTLATHVGETGAAWSILNPVPAGQNSYQSGSLTAVTLSGGAAQSAVTNTSPVMPSGGAVVGNTQTIELDFYCDDGGVGNNTEHYLGFLASATEGYELSFSRSGSSGLLYCELNYYNPGYSNLGWFEATIADFAVQTLRIEVTPTTKVVKLGGVTQISVSHSGGLTTGYDFLNWRGANLFWVSRLLIDGSAGPPQTGLLRDDFTGSGGLIGRTPDGVNAGPWVNAPATWSSTPADASVTGGALTLVAGAGKIVAAYAPLSPQPADAYVEVRVTGPARAAGQQLAVGIRWLEGTPSGWVTGIQAAFFCKNSTTIHADVVRYPSGTQMNSTFEFTVANAFDYVLRLETEGTAVRLYLDGALQYSGTQNEATAAGNAYLLSSANATDHAAVQYIEANLLAAPPPPPPAFWQSFVGSHEVV